MWYENEVKYEGNTYYVIAHIMGPGDDLQLWHLECYADETGPNIADEMPEEFCEHVIDIAMGA